MGALSQDTNDEQQQPTSPKSVASSLPVEKGSREQAQSSLIQQQHNNSTTDHDNMDDPNEVADMVIIGGGIVGLVLALALKKHCGVICSIYERTACFLDDVGAGMGMYPNGLRVIRDISQQLFADIQNAGLPYLYRKWTRHDGTTIMVADETVLCAETQTQTQEETTVTSEDDNDNNSEATASTCDSTTIINTDLQPIGIRRWKLQKVLYEHCQREGIPVHFGKQTLSIGSEPVKDKDTSNNAKNGDNDIISILFADGTTKKTKVVFAADGAKSKVREIVTGLGIAETLKYTGTTCLMGIAEMETGIHSNNNDDNTTTTTTNNNNDAKNESNTKCTSAPKQIGSDSSKDIKHHRRTRRARRNSNDAMKCDNTALFHSLLDENQFQDSQLQNRGICFPSSATSKCHGCFFPTGPNEMCFQFHFPTPENETVSTSWGTLTRQLSRKECYKLANKLHEEGWASQYVLPLQQKVTKAIRIGFYTFKQPLQRLVYNCPKTSTSSSKRLNEQTSSNIKNVVLLGDAAHPPVPYIGQGAQMGIEDAGVIAVLLQKLCCSNSNSSEDSSKKNIAFDGTNFHYAMHLYERLRLPRQHFIQSSSEFLGRMQQKRADSARYNKVKEQMIQRQVFFHKTLPNLLPASRYDYKHGIQQMLDSEEKDAQEKMMLSSPANQDNCENNTNCNDYQSQNNNNHNRTSASGQKALLLLSAVPEEDNEDSTCTSSISESINKAHSSSQKQQPAGGLITSHQQLEVKQ